MSDFQSAAILFAAVLTAIAAAIFTALIVKK